MSRNRFAALLLAASAALGATAAPAPVYKETGFEDWVYRWHKPVDPVGGCRFNRAGGKLAISLPRGHSCQLGMWRAGKDVPHILREVDGDFDVQVRITGGFDIPDGACEHNNDRQAGLVLDGGDTNYFSAWTTWFKGKWIHVFMAWNQGPERETADGCELGPVGRRTYHRLSRRGNSVRMSVSLDGKEWVQLEEQDVGVLPKVVRVGVFACKSGPIPFKVTFDEFKLTPLK